MEESGTMAGKAIECYEPSLMGYSFRNLEVKNAGRNMDSASLADEVRGEQEHNQALEQGYPSMCYLGKESDCILFLF